MSLILKVNGLFFFSPKGKDGLLQSKISFDKEAVNDLFDLLRERCYCCHHARRSNPRCPNQ